MLKSEDRTTIRRLGRDVAQNLIWASLVEAAMYIAIVKGTSDENSLRMEFQEGVRNNVENMVRYDVVMYALEDQIKQYHPETCQGEFDAPLERGGKCYTCGFRLDEHAFYPKLQFKIDN